MPVGLGNGPPHRLILATANGRAEDQNYGRRNSGPTTTSAQSNNYVPACGTSTMGGSSSSTAFAPPERAVGAAAAQDRPYNNQHARNVPSPMEGALFSKINSSSRVQLQKTASTSGYVKQAAHKLQGARPPEPQLQHLVHQRGSPTGGEQQNNWSTSARAFVGLRSPIGSPLSDNGAAAGGPSLQELDVTQLHVGDYNGGPVVDTTGPPMRAGNFAAPARRNRQDEVHKQHEPAPQPSPRTELRMLHVSEPKREVEQQNFYEIAKTPEMTSQATSAKIHEQTRVQVSPTSGGSLFELRGSAPEVPPRSYRHRSSLQALAEGKLVSQSKSRWATRATTPRQTSTVASSTEFDEQEPIVPTAEDPIVSGGTPAAHGRGEDRIRAGKKGTASSSSSTTFRRLPVDHGAPASQLRAEKNVAERGEQVKPVRRRGDDARERESSTRAARGDLFPPRAEFGSAQHVSRRAEHDGGSCGSGKKDHHQSRMASREASASSRPVSKQSAPSRAVQQETESHKLKQAQLERRSRNLSTKNLLNNHREDSRSKFDGAHRTAVEIGPTASGKYQAQQQATPLTPGPASRDVNASGLKDPHSSRKKLDPESVRKLLLRGEDTWRGKPPSGGKLPLAADQMNTSTGGKMNRSARDITPARIVHQTPLSSSRFLDHHKLKFDHATPVVTARAVEAVAHNTDKNCAKVDHNSTSSRSRAQTEASSVRLHQSRVSLEKESGPASQSISRKNALAAEERRKERRKPNWWLNRRHQSSSSPEKKEGGGRAAKKSNLQDSPPLLTDKEKEKLKRLAVAPPSKSEMPPKSHNSAEATLNVAGRDVTTRADRGAGSSCSRQHYNSSKVEPPGRGQPQPDPSATRSTKHPPPARAPEEKKSASATVHHDHATSSTDTVSRKPTGLTGHQRKFSSPHGTKREGSATRPASSIQHQSTASSTASATTNAVPRTSPGPSTAVMQQKSSKFAVDSKKRRSMRRSMAVMERSQKVASLLEDFTAEMDVATLLRLYAKMQAEALDAIGTEEKQMELMRAVTSSSTTTSTRGAGSTATGRKSLVPGMKNPQNKLNFPYHIIRRAMKGNVNWKVKSIYENLDKLPRRRVDERKRVVIVGAGPCGLRLAIELVLGGHQVVVLEKRSLCDSRINRLHLWNWVRAEVEKFSGRVFLPTAVRQAVFADADFCHLGIDELQALLVKNALLLGVEIRIGVAYEGADPVPRIQARPSVTEHNETSARTDSGLLRLGAKSNNVAKKAALFLRPPTNPEPRPPPLPRGGVCAEKSSDSTQNEFWTTRAAYGFGRTKKGKTTWHIRVQCPAGPEKEEKTNSKISTASSEQAEPSSVQVLTRDAVKGQVTRKKQENSPSDQDTLHFTLEADVLVGADGPRSIVATSQSDRIGPRIVSDFSEAIGVVCNLRRQKVGESGRSSAPVVPVTSIATMNPRESVGPASSASASLTLPEGCSSLLAANTTRTSCPSQMLLPARISTPRELIGHNLNNRFLSTAPTRNTPDSNEKQRSSTGSFVTALSSCNRDSTKTFLPSSRTTATSSLKIERPFLKSATFDETFGRSSDSVIATVGSNGAGGSSSTSSRWKRADTAPIQVDSNTPTTTTNATSSSSSFPHRPLSPARNRNLGNEEKRQFSWARQFNAGFFQDVEKICKLALENLVYYRGPDSHYIIMTPTRASLLSCKVDLTNNVSIWKPVLRQQLRLLLNWLGIFGEFVPDPNDVMAFDFSSTFRASHPFAVKNQQQPISPSATSSGINTFGSSSAATTGETIDCHPPVALAGDALLEPFWPEGLGIIRGFLGALDCCWAVDFAYSMPDKDLLDYSNQAFTKLKSVHSHSRTKYLIKDESRWDVNPNTRYTEIGVLPAPSPTGFLY
ncbi:unnamed protein product [Amoebophrya sp. A120]|nr:unnamed protein product [Amoebophrya sp. A120]|eukprot:GSA120T00005453001.1